MFLGKLLKMLKLVYNYGAQGLFSFLEYSNVIVFNHLIPMTEAKLITFFIILLSKACLDFKARKENYQSIYYLMS